MEIIRVIFAGIFLFSGLFILAIATIGLFRLDNVLNRLHAAAKCDTLGALLVLIGLAIIVGISFTALKFFILIAFIWLTNPVSAFMIARAEVLTNPNIEEECDVREL
jgi:multicomponent Na+:H+ antiporter subunit G